MATIEMKGLYKVVSKGRTYWYAWRNGPRIDAEPGSDKFLALYGEAIAERGVGDKQRFKSIAIRYRASKDYRDLADSTRKNWGPWLDQIITRFGDLRTKLFERPAIRKDITRWRSEMAETRGPRAADYGMQVLSRVCAYGIDPLGELSMNPCEGIKQVYKVDRSEIIWTDDDIAQLKKTCSKEIAFAVDLAAHTGLRVGDLIRLSWSHIGEDAIVLSTGKSRHKREAIIPLYDGLRDLLARIPKKSPVVLTSSKKRPWTRDGMSSSFVDAKRAAWPPNGRDLHFHDLRGTAVTKFYVAGLDERVIAEMMAWEEDHVKRIIRRYVNRSAAIKDTIRRLNEAKKPALSGVVETKFIVSPSVKSHAIAAANLGGGIYFAHAVLAGRVKIGIAENPLTRMSHLSIGSPEQLVLAAVIPGGRETESYLHHWFRQSRVKGEWFEASAGILAFVEAISERPMLDWKAWLNEFANAKVIRMERDQNGA